MRIALIDGGIEPSNCSNLLLEYDLHVGKDCTVVRRGSGQRIQTDHGTISAQIICKYAPSAELCSLQVFETKQLKTSIGQLLAALEWCYQQKIPIIHLSLGSTLYLDYDFLRRETAKLLRNGQVLVAAHSNNNSYTMPACFMGVLGVMTDGTYQEDEYNIKDIGWEQVQILASSRHKLMLEDGEIMETQVSNSYAAPLITAKVHEIMCSLEEGWKPSHLVYQKLSCQNGNMFRMRPDFLDEVILFQKGVAEIREELFFFTVKESVGNLIDLEVAIDKDPYAPVIIVPSGNWKVDKKACQLCCERCRFGCLYAGRAPGGFKNMKFLFWDERQYSDFLRQSCHVSKRHLMEGIARILLEGEESSLLFVAVRMRQVFHEHKYPCIIISDYPCAYLYNMEYLPDGIELEMFIMDVAILRQASVVIYCLKGSTRKKWLDYDFKVSVGKSEVMHAIGKNIYIPKVFNIEKVYQYILRY